MKAAKKPPGLTNVNEIVRCPARRFDDIRFKPMDDSDHFIGAWHGRNLTRMESLKIAPSGPSTPNLLRALDALEHGVAICDGRGEMVHANGPLEREWSREGGSWLRTEIQRFARVAAAHARSRRLTGTMIEPLGVDSIELAGRRWRLRASFAGGVVPYGGALIVVTVQNATLGDTRLRERFGLTRQEVRIARLLADGRSNREIASLLFISPHTARHHTDSVLRKLNVTSRAAVAGTLLRLQP